MFTFEAEVSFDNRLLTRQITLKFMETKLQKKFKKVLQGEKKTDTFFSNEQLLLNIKKSSQRNNILKNNMYLI